MITLVNNRTKSTLESLIVCSADFIFILATFKLAVLIRANVLPHIYTGFPTEFPFGRFIDAWWFFIIWIFFFICEGLYAKRFSFWDEIKALWKAILYSVIGILVIVTLGKLSAEVSRTVVLLMGLLAMGIMPLARGILKKGLRRLGFLKRKALILGAGETGRLVLRALKKERNYGYVVLGFIDDDPEVRGRIVDGLKVHKGLDRVERYIDTCGIQDVFVAISEAEWGKIRNVINRLQHKAERVFFVPGFSGIAVLGMSLQHFFYEQAFAFELKNNLAMPLNSFMKRLFDIAFCILLLPFIAVIIGIFALLIRLTSKGRAFFSISGLGRTESHCGA
jgi:undecaprenyl-phosphate galactose phosphotransferase